MTATALFELGAPSALVAMTRGALWAVSRRLRSPLSFPRPGPHNGHDVYRASKDSFLAQRFARHASPLTTVICVAGAASGRDNAMDAADRTGFGRNPSRLNA